jgi:hypothetical protein
METQHNQQQHGTSSQEGGQDHARGEYPTGFGRGWIPAGRDIGIPGEFPAYSAVAPDADKPVESYWAPVYGQSGVDGQPGVDPDDRDFAVPVSIFHFGPPRRAAFLHHLAEDGNVRKACAAIGVSTQAAYLARRRDVVFRAGWAAALVVAREQVAQVLATRAIEGYRDPIYYRGTQIGERVRFDTRLLLAHLARLDTRADDAVAEAHAERFDEILALVAGEAFPAEMEDLPDGRSYEADLLLPIARDRFVEHAAADAVAQARWGPGGTENQGLYDDPADDEPEEPTPLDLAENAARETAHTVQDDWDGRVAAVNDALAVGALPRVLAVAWPAGVGAEFGAGEAGGGEFGGGEFGGGVPGGEVAPGGEGGWAPASAGATGEGGGPAHASAQPVAASTPQQAEPGSSAHQNNPPHPSNKPVAPAEAGAHQALPESTEPAPGVNPSELTSCADAAPGREAGWAPASAGATGEGGETAAIVEQVSKVTPRPKFSPRTVSTVSTSRKPRAGKRKREAAKPPVTDALPATEAAPVVTEAKPRAAEAELPVRQRAVPRVHFF